MTSPSMKSGEKDGSKSPIQQSRNNLNLSMGDDAATAMQKSSTHFTHGYFSWLRVFRLADLMLRTGC